MRFTQALSFLFLKRRDKTKSSVNDEKYAGNYDDDVQAVSESKHKTYHNRKYGSKNIKSVSCAAL